MASERCNHCGSVLPWPYVQLSPRQRKVLVAISTGIAFSSSKALARHLKMRDSNVRAIISQIDKKLAKNDKYTIRTKPYRVLEVKRIATIPPQLVSPEK